METWYSFKNHELVIEPSSEFEMSFLTDLLGDNARLICTTLVSEHDNSVVGIVLKPQKDLANSSESDITAIDVDIMYKEMLDEGVIDE